MVTRRNFLASAAGVFASAAAASTGEMSPKLMSAARVGAEHGGILWQKDATSFFHLPARGHALARLPQNRVALIGRRPGLFSSIVDPGDVEAPVKVFEPARNCRFSGHAAASADGAHFVTSEFEAVSVAAVLVSRDSK